MTTWLTSLAVLLCACFLSETSGSAIVFQSSESSIKPLLTNKLTLTCSLHDTTPVVPVVGRSLTSGHEGDALADDVMTGLEKDTQTDQQDSVDPDDSDDQTISKLNQTTENMPFVTSIMISRDGIDLATITEHFPAKPVGGASGFQVSGQLPGTSGDKGHIELVWTHPTQAQSGNYVCDVDTLSSQGRSHYFSQSLEVSEEEISIKDLVSHVHQMQLEKEKMNATIGTMLKTEETLKTDNSALHQSLDALRKIARVEPSVFFSALLTSSKSIPVNQAVIYDKVLSNEGASYSNSTGTFTCPVDGFYHFEIHAYAAGSGYGYLSLRHNGNNVISVNTNLSGTHKGCSNSATIKLAKGDTVKVVSSYGTASLYYDSPHYILNTFTGHLISLV